MLIPEDFLFSPPKKSHKIKNQLKKSILVSLKWTYRWVWSRGNKVLLQISNPTGITPTTTDGAQSWDAHPEKASTLNWGYYSATCSFVIQCNIELIGMVCLFNQWKNTLLNEVHLHGSTFTDSFLLYHSHQNPGWRILFLSHSLY